MKINKKLFFIIIIILLIIFCIFIFKNMIKKSKNGNNMNSQEIVDYILNVKKYKANISVQVNSNKNKNKYILNQEYNEENEAIQEVVEPVNITGVKIIKKDGNLKIENSNLNLSTIFENYQGIGENYLDLNVFINDYKNYEKSNFEEKEKEIQNDLGNKYSPTVIAAAITSQTNKTKLPTHIEINGDSKGLKNNSVILAEQIRTIDKSRLKEKIGHIDDELVMNKINNALGVSFGLGE